MEKEKQETVKPKIRSQNYQCRFCERPFGWKETPGKFIQFGDHARSCKALDLDDPTEWVVIDN